MIYAPMISLSLFRKNIISGLYGCKKNSPKRAILLIKTSDIHCPNNLLKFPIKVLLAL